MSIVMGNMEIGDKLKGKANIHSVSVRCWPTLAIRTAKCLDPHLCISTRRMKIILQKDIPSFGNINPKSIMDVNSC